MIFISASFALTPDIAGSRPAEPVINWVTILKFHIDRPIYYEKFRLSLP